MDMSKRLDELEARVSALESHGKRLTAVPSTPAGKSMSLREFINRAAPATSNDTALLVGHYIETIKGQGYFTNDDLRTGFAEAKLPAPKNISDIIAKNAKKGFIMVNDAHSGRLKAWVLTNTGELTASKMLDTDE